MYGMQGQLYVTCILPVPLFASLQALVQQSGYVGVYQFTRCSTAERSRRCTQLWAVNTACPGIIVVGFHQSQQCAVTAAAQHCLCSLQAGVGLVCTCNGMLGPFNGRKTIVLA